MFSPAKLRGLLLEHKKTPRKALEKVEAWVSTMRKEKAGKTRVVALAVWWLWRFGGFGGLVALAVWWLWRFSDFGFLFLFFLSRWYTFLLSNEIPRSK
jgi:hypothetical protein